MRMSDLVLQRANLAVRDPGPDPFVGIVGEKFHACVREAHGHGEVETVGQEVRYAPRDDGRHDAPADRLHDASFRSLQRSITINPIELVGLYSS